MIGAALTETGGIQVNGGTGDYSLVAGLFCLVFVLGPFALVALRDWWWWRRDQEHPRAAAASSPAPRLLSPDACPVCRQPRDWHAIGCSALDRRDTPRLPHHPTSRSSR